mmetsp:Transcript_1034/g.2286  ORF Transcript_1034/g.2286 Transcript_1034/m.2286 type:complete len:88 (-) Transcript_1034:186-449(-)
MEAGAPVPWLPSPLPAAPRQAPTLPTAEDAARLLQQVETEDGADGEALARLLEGMGRIPETYQRQLEEIRAGDATVELVLEVLRGIQ